MRDYRLKERRTGEGHFCASYIPGDPLKKRPKQQDQDEGLF